MKILQLVTKRQFRGAEVFAANLSSELITLGHEVVFVGLYKNHTDVLKVKDAKNFDLIEEKKSAFSVQLTIELNRLIKSEKPDIVQCNGSDTLKYMVAVSFLFPRLPIVYRNISVISEWIDGKVKHLIYKALFKRVNHVTSVGTESIYDLIKTLNYPEEKTSVIRRGIPISTIKETNYLSLKNELQLEAGDKIVMHVGNFSPEKNHAFLINVFSDIKRDHPNIKLVCIGNGLTFNDIEQQIKDNRLEDTVYLLGFRKDIPELLSQCECFVLSSLIEGVPGVILEAGAQKKPTVATNVGGVKEVLINEVTGYIIDNFDKEEFKSKIIKLVEDKQVNKTLGESAYNLVLKDFNPVLNAKKFETLYLNLTGIETSKKISKSPGKLKILHLIQKKQFRGAEVFTCQLSDHLIELGQEVEIVSIFDGEADLPFSKPIKSLNRARSQRIFDIKGWRTLSAIIEEFKPDIVQANASDTLKYAVFSKLFFRWKTILVYRNASSSSFYIRTVLARRLNSFLLNKVDLIISVSKTSKKDINDLFPFTKFKSLVIPVGINKNIVENSVIGNIPDSIKYTIVHIGSFTREKNHLGILSIFKKILNNEPNVHLNLIGSGPLENEIKLAVNEMNLVNEVSFLGEVKNPFPYLKTGHVLILPSIIEGLPGVILEAMVNSIPVVAYDVGGISEVVNEKSGYLIPKNDEQKFAETVLAVLKNRDPEMLIYSKSLVLTEFSNETITQKFLDSYRKIVARKEEAS